MDDFMDLSGRKKRIEKCRHICMAAVVDDGDVRLLMAGFKKRLETQLEIAETFGKIAVKMRDINRYDDLMDESGFAFGDIPVWIVTDAHRIVRLKGKYNCFCARDVV